MVSCSAFLTVMRAFEQLCIGCRTNSCLQQARWEGCPCMCLVCLSVYDVQLAFCHSTWTFPPCFPAARTHSRRRGCPSLAQEEDSLPNQRIEKLPEVRYHRHSNYYISCTHIHVLYTEWQCPWHCVNDVMWLYYNNCLLTWHHMMSCDCTITTVFAHVTSHDVVLHVTCMHHVR